LKGENRKKQGGSYRNEIRIEVEMEVEIETNDK
jgi:hypothetical protein